MELSQVTMFPELLAAIIAKLDTACIRYMLTGSAGMVVYTVPRMTRDVDLVIECDASDARRLTELFQDDWFVDEVSVRDAIRDKRSFNIIQKERFFKADLILRKDTEFRRHEFGRRRRMRIDDWDVWVASAEDLILSKIQWSANGDSAFQLRDAKQMAMLVPELDWEYLRTWAERLGLEKLLREIEPDA